MMNGRNELSVAYRRDLAWVDYCLNARDSQ